MVNQVISTSGFDPQGPIKFDCKFFVIFVCFVVDKYYPKIEEKIG